jgi:hypothetical protein
LSTAQRKFGYGPAPKPLVGAATRRAVDK